MRAGLMFQRGEGSPRYVAVPRQTASHTVGCARITPHTAVRPQGNRAVLGHLWVVAS